MTKMISILGSTGSIGKNAVKAAERLHIPIAALAARSNVKLLEEQARRFRPRLVAVYEERAARDLKIALRDTEISVLSGEGGLIEAATVQGADCVLTAVSGSIGLKPTLAAIDMGRRIALANKETLVCAGEIVMARSAEKGAEIIPVDSEHSAIFQCLVGRNTREFTKILLTASGGPFRGLTWAEMMDKTPKDALRHPNWSMGAKITIDSASMMNKGLEFIEAMHLFGAAPEQIEIIVHPESVVHSMVEFRDGAVLAQMGVPDMSIPIQYAMTYPERSETETLPLDLFSLGTLTFEKPDYDAFPMLALAKMCAELGGGFPAAMSAANEEAVGAFLRGDIFFAAIYELTARAVDNNIVKGNISLEALIEADIAARRCVIEGVKECI